MVELGLVALRVRYARDWRWLWLRKRKRREFSYLTHPVPHGKWVRMEATLRAGEQTLEVESCVVLDT